MIFMSFRGLQTFKVNTFTETSLEYSILNHLQTKVTAQNPSLVFFFSIYNPKEVIVLTNLFF